LLLATKVAVNLGGSEDSLIKRKIIIDEQLIKGVT
jgi:hypothetical protein